MLRERVDALRLRVLLRAGFFAALESVDEERLAAGVADFARLDADFLAAPVLRAVLLRVVDFARVEVLRALVERFEPVLREELEALAVSSVVHLPDITRCAASATASAIKVPSLVALAMTLLAA